jgi:spermidine/putrescine ABC transporter ATP-binding subunit
VTSSKPGEQRGSASGIAVRIVDLSKSYGHVHAVAGVTLTVEAGEFLALLGPSGSGKTTILMTLAGFERPTAGEIYFGSQAVTSVAPHRRDLGMVFQRYALFPHLTVAENIGFPLRMRLLSTVEVRARVAEALATIGLSGYGARMPHELSGGQQQRVALARAIVYRPSLLLMDEPLGALDKKLRGRMQLEIKDLQRRLGATVIYVTHDQDEALTMADRIAVLKDGRVMQIGEPDVLYEQPANSFVAEFVGETNMFRGVLTSAESAWTVTVPDMARLEVAAPTRAEVESGSEVCVAVRPERITLQRSGVSGAGHPAIVRERVYAGASVLYVVELASGRRIDVRLPAGHRESFKRGDAVDVTWRSADAVVCAVNN